MEKLILRWFINAVALAVAVWLVPGIVLRGETDAWITLAVMAAVFGLVNAVIRPVLKFLTCPLIVLTLGLFTLVINGLMLWLSSWLAGLLGLGFHVDGFWPAFWGALVISIVSFVLSMVLGGDDKRRSTAPRDRW